MTGFAIIDAETDPFLIDRIPVPFAWGLFDGSTFSHWWGVGRESEFIAALQSLPPDTVVYGHNAGRFDTHFLLPWLDPDRELFIVDGRIARCWIKGGPQIRDSFMLIPEPLSAWSKTKIDYEKFESIRRERHRGEIVAYLRDDCERLYELVEAFRLEHGDALTLATAAMRKLCELCDIERPRATESFDSIMRPYYYGGRVQTFQIGEIEGPLKLWDINSAYAHAMRESHPIGHDRIAINRLPEKPEVLARSFARIQAISGGALPYRDSDGLTFPCDDQVRVYNATGHEILAGLETETLKIVKIECCIIFVDWMNFRPFIDHYWDLRSQSKKAGDKLSDLIYKRTMNGAYGKFAQNPANRRHYKIADHKRIHTLESEGFELAGLLGPWYLMQKPKPSAFGYLNVATAASITGFVRAQLLRAIAAAVDPIYCDTDCILARDLSGIEFGSNLGAWKLEAEASKAWIGGKKLYALKLADSTWKTASKGVKLEPSEIREVAAGGTVEYASPVPTFKIGTDPTFIRREIRRTGVRTWVRKQ